MPPTSAEQINNTNASDNQGASSSRENGETPITTGKGAIVRNAPRPGSRRAPTTTAINNNNTNNNNTSEASTAVPLSARNRDPNAGVEGLVADYAGPTPQRRLTPDTINPPPSNFPLDKAEAPFRLPHIDRLLYFDSKAKEVRPWPKKEYWPEAKLKEEPFRPPNPATKLVKKCKTEIKTLKKEIPEERPYDDEETYQDYSLDKVNTEPDKSLISERVNENGIRIRIPATKMREKWDLPEHTDLYEGPINDGNVLKHTTTSDCCKHDTKEINEMSTFERAQLWKYTKYRQDGISFAEAEKEMKQENLSRLLLMSYATASRAQCERCNPTPATTGSRRNPFRYTEAETNIRCGVRPGLEHLTGGVNEDGTPETVCSDYIIQPPRSSASLLEEEAKDRRRWKTTAEEFAVDLERRRKELEERNKVRRPMPVLSCW